MLAFVPKQSQIIALTVQKLSDILVTDTADLLDISGGLGDVLERDTSELKPWHGPPEQGLLTSGALELRLGLPCFTQQAFFMLEALCQEVV